MGSWRFIAIQTVIVVVWISSNAFLFFNFDFLTLILLNLAFSIQVAYAAPRIVLAETRILQLESNILGRLDHSSGSS